MQLGIVQDLRYSIRSLRKSPGFTAIAVLTLALGAGSNTAVFSLINAVMLRPLPYAQPEQLVLVWESAPFFGVRDSPVSPANYVDWRARSRSFEEMGTLEIRAYRLIGEGAPEVVVGGLVTPSLLRALRIRPALGRIFREDEDQPGAPKVALVSDGFWKRRFGADPKAIGKTLSLSGESHTIVGVLAAGNEPPSQYGVGLGEIWTPFWTVYSAREWANRGRHNWMVAARLRPGVPLEQANAEMEAIGANLSREYPDTNEKVGAFVAPMRNHFVGSSRRVLLILFGTVAFVLLIACANLVNLLLCRAANSRKEVAIRAALGTGTWRLARRFFAESLLLSAAGSALGLLLATATFRFLAHLAPPDMAGLKTLSIDWRVLAFTLGITAAATLVFGLAPLVQIRRLDLNHALKQSARSVAAASGSRRVRALLICSEVALAFVLLIGAGLLIQTYARLRGVDVGCRTHNILTLRLPPSDAQCGPERAAIFQREVLRGVAAIPGVDSAGFTNHIPLVVKGDITQVGADGLDPRTKISCRARMAGPGYLRTMGIPLRAGRDLDERDSEGSPRVVLINETLARTAWPNQNPIGRRLVFGTNLRAEVVGVVGDLRQAGLDVPSKPEFYASTLQVPMSSVSLAIHSTVEPTSLAPAVRQAIWSVDPDQPVAEVASMEEILDKEVFERRVQTTLLAAFAGLALLLAAIGLYGVLAYLVGQQAPEIGLRMALGAGPAEILRRVVGHGLRLTLIGLLLGIAGALAVSRLIASVLYGVKPADPATYVSVALVLLVTAAVASYIPARRAVGVDPIVALREE